MSRYAATGQPQAVARWNLICAEADRLEAEWVAWLRAGGIKAAHPDDGWVKRNTDQPTDGSRRDLVQFAYPQFNDNPARGDLIALGWPDRFRVVRVTDVRDEGWLFNKHTVWEFAP